MIDQELAIKLFMFLVLVCSLSLHEWGHAFAADKLGDPLPRLQGRVTLNPLAHIDPIGTIAIPLLMILLSPGFAIIGWAKPVQVSLPNPKTRMRDDLVSTAAGPAMNLLLAIVLAIALAFATRYGSDLHQQAVFMALYVNLLLLVFNLLPIPPLDGSHFLPYAGMSRETYARIARFSLIILIILINIPVFWTLMRTIIEWLMVPLLFLTDGVLNLLS